MASSDTSASTSTSTISPSTRNLQLDPNCTRFAEISETGLNIYNLSAADKSLNLEYREANILKTLREKNNSATDTIFLMELHYEKPIVALVTNENRFKVYLLDCEKKSLTGLEVNNTIMRVKFYRGFMVAFYTSCSETFLIDNVKDSEEVYDEEPKIYRDIPYDSGRLATMAHECTALGGCLVAFPCNGAKNPGKIKIDKGIEKPELGGYIEWSDYGWFQPLAEAISFIYFNSSGTRLAIAEYHCIFIYSILPSVENLYFLESCYLRFNKEYKFITMSITACGQYLVADTSGEYAYALYLWEVESTEPSYNTEKRGVAIKFKPNVEHICGIAKLQDELGLVIGTAASLYVYSMPKSLDKIKLYNGYHLDPDSAESESKCMSRDEIISCVDINYPPLDDDDADWTRLPLKYGAVRKPVRSPAKYAGVCRYRTNDLVKKYLGYLVFGDSTRNHFYCDCDVMAKATVLARKSLLESYRPQSTASYIGTFITNKIHFLRQVFITWRGRIRVCDDDKPSDSYERLKEIAKNEEAFKKSIEAAISQPCHYTCSCYRS